MFYAGVYPIPMYYVNDDAQLVPLKTELDNKTFHPNYVVFFGKEDIDKRVQHIESLLKLKITLLRRIEPSFLDDIFYRLNPRNNKNETSFVFKIDM
jgi:hypothetical protein